MGGFFSVRSRPAVWNVAHTSTALMGRKSHRSEKGSNQLAVLSLLSSTYYRESSLKYEGRRKFKLVFSCIVFGLTKCLYKPSCLLPCSSLLLLKAWKSCVYVWLSIYSSYFTIILNFRIVHLLFFLCATHNRVPFLKNWGESHKIIVYS